MLESKRRGILARSYVRVSIAQLPTFVNSQLLHAAGEADISMSTFKTVAKIGDIPPGEGRAYEVDGRMVAIFLIEGQYHAIDDFCPHMGASLAGGGVEDGMVTCPWHAWRFSLCDGSWCDNPAISVDTFEIRLAGEEIQVSVALQDKPPNNGQGPDQNDL